MATKRQIESAIVALTKGKRSAFRIRSMRIQTEKQHKADMKRWSRAEKTIFKALKGWHLEEVEWFLNTHIIRGLKRRFRV